MQVREVKGIIGDLKNVYDNMIKIQNCCLENDDAQESIKELEEKANINTSLRNLVSNTAIYISKEICRLENVIDNAVVKID